MRICYFVWRRYGSMSPCTSSVVNANKANSNINSSGMNWKCVLDHKGRVKHYSEQGKITEIIIFSTSVTAIFNSSYHERFPSWSGCQLRTTGPRFLEAPSTTHCCDQLANHSAITHPSKNRLALTQPHTYIYAHTKLSGGYVVIVINAVID